MTNGCLIRTNNQSTLSYEGQPMVFPHRLSAKLTLAKARASSLLLFLLLKKGGESSAACFLLSSERRLRRRRDERGTLVHLS